MPERERWRKVRRAAGYEVSDRGRARSVKRTLSDGRVCGGGLLEPTIDADGYRRIRVGGQLEMVHLLVLEAFDRPCPPGMEGRHLDDDHANNRLVNLRWGTHRENEQDKRRNTIRIEKENRTSVSSPELIVTSVTGGLR